MCAPVLRPRSRVQWPSATDPRFRDANARSAFWIGQVNSTREYFQPAIAVASNEAHAHFDQASVFASQHQTEQAAEHFRIAARLDSRYAQLLSD